MSRGSRDCESDIAVEAVARQERYEGRAAGNQNIAHGVLRSQRVRVGGGQAGLKKRHQARSSGDRLVGNELLLLVREQPKQGIVNLRDGGSKGGRIRDDRVNNELPRIPRGLQGGIRDNANRKRVWFTRISAQDYLYIRHCNNPLPVVVAGALLEINLYARRKAPRSPAISSVRFSGVSQLCCPAIICGSSRNAMPRATAHKEGGAKQVLSCWDGADNVGRRSQRTSVECSRVHRKATTDFSEAKAAAQPTAADGSSTAGVRAGPTRTFRCPPASICPVAPTLPKPPAGTGPAV